MIDQSLVAAMNQNIERNVGPRQVIAKSQTYGKETQEVSLDPGRFTEDDLMQGLDSTPITKGEMLSPLGTHLASKGILQKEMQQLRVTRDMGGERQDVGLDERDLTDEDLGIGNADEAFGLRSEGVVEDEIPNEMIAQQDLEADKEEMFGENKKDELVERKEEIKKLSSKQIQQLLALANKYDSAGQFEKAAKIDRIIKQALN